MSETDDTDVLLLIPPDFFLVRSSDDSSCPETARTVVPKAFPARRSLSALHATIGSLEHRVASLELSVSPRTKHSSFSSDRRSPNAEKLHGIERRSYTFPRRRRRKIFTKRREFDLSLVSTHSSSICEDIPTISLSETPSGLIEIQQEFNNHSFVMDSEISSVVSSPKKNDKMMLSEIDDFLDKVDTYESPEKCRQSDCSNDKIIEQYSARNDGNEVTLPSGRKVPQEYLNRYIYLVKNQNEQPTTSKRYDLTNEEITSDFDKCRYTRDLKSTSARKLNFNELKTENKSTPYPKGLHRVNTLPNMEIRPFKSLEKTSKMLEHCNLSSLSPSDTISNISSYASPVKDQFKFRKYSSDRDINADKIKRKVEAKLPHSVDTDLLSLSELWNDKDGLRADNAKLEEERLKREHCETVIQELQKKVLEQQEKIAVAVKVDRAKDNAISRLREAWVRLANNLETTESKHKMAIEKINNEMVKLRQSAEDAQKKTRHFESEMYKTLDLAHDYQEKCRQAQRDKQTVEADRDKLLAEKAELLQKRDEETESVRENYDSVVRINKQLTDCIKSTEDNLEKEKISHDETKSELASVNKLTQNYQEELTLIQQEKEILKEKLNEERSRICLLENHMSDTQNRLMDAQKREKLQEGEIKNLRKHLEVQKEELKAYYQKQLEESVLAKLQEFQQQLDSAEREMERDARERENGVVDTYNKRIDRIEEQHKLEVQVLEEKQKEEIKLYRLQLAQAGEKISALEGKLDSYRQRRGEIAAQLHSVMQSQWRQALDILSGQGSHRDKAQSRSRGYPEQSAPDLRPALTTYQASGSERLNLTGLSSERRYATDGLSDTEIQHYVKMLLTRPPDQQDSSGEVTSVKCEPHEEPTTDKTEEERAHRPGRRQGVKPPWKA